MMKQKFREALIVTAFTWLAWALLFLLLYFVSVWTGGNDDTHLWLVGFVVSGLVMNVWHLRYQRII